MLPPVPNVETDIHGDAWVARIEREHERHAGIPDYGWCPRRHSGKRPWPRVISSADLDRQRWDYGFRQRVADCEAYMRGSSDGRLGCANRDEHREPWT